MLEKSLTTLVKISSLLGDALARTTSFPVNLLMTGFNTMVYDLPVVLLIDNKGQANVTLSGNPLPTIISSLIIEV